MTRLSLAILALGCTSYPTKSESTPRDSALQDSAPTDTDNCAPLEIAYDGVDNDCDPLTRDDDLDADGYVLAADCDDLDATINPNASESPADGIDNDCDPATTDDDLDGDGSPTAEDCDDTDEVVYPGAAEICGDGVVNDCGAPLSHLGCLDIGDASAATLEGEEMLDNAGWSVASAGDVDGDGLSDVLVGAPGRDGLFDVTGAAYLLSGPLDGTRSLSTADATIQGEVEWDRVGSALDSAGDLDGDGLDDVLLGVDGLGTGGCPAGSAYLFLGSLAGSMNLSNADVHLVGEKSGDCAGSDVSGGGDLNGDGQGDLLVGAYAEDSSGADAGAAYMVLGPMSDLMNLSDADAKFLAEDAHNLVSEVEAGAGDLDGDGRDDLAISAPNNGSSGGAQAGAVYILTSLPSGVMSLSDADLTLSGESADDVAGTDLSNAGDTNGDGYMDLLVGARGESTGGTVAGAAYVVLGPVEGSASLASCAAKMVGEESGDQAGTVAGPGDVNGDGLADVAVGAWLQDSVAPYAGAAYILLSPLAGTVDLAEATVKFSAESKADYAGSSLSGADDVDGDGFADLLVGAQLNDNTSEDAGAVYLILGGGY